MMSSRPTYSAKGMRAMLHTTRTMICFVIDDHVNAWASSVDLFEGSVRILFEGSARICSDHVTSLCQWRHQPPSVGLVFGHQPKRLCGHAACTAHRGFGATSFPVATSIDRAERHGWCRAPSAPAHCGQGLHQDLQCTALR